MADVYGRLTGRAGVCLATLGPGATNLVTGVADANMDHAPVVAISGQSSTTRMHKETHQYLDLVNLFRPISKYCIQVVEPETIRRGGPQGVQAGPGREARRQLHRFSREHRQYGTGRRRAAAVEPSPAIAGGRRTDRAGGRHPLRRQVSADPGRQRRHPCAGRGTARPIRRKTEYPGRQHVHGQGGRFPFRIRFGWAPSACSGATWWPAASTGPT